MGVKSFFGFGKSKYFTGTRGIAVTDSSGKSILPLSFTAIGKGTTDPVEAVRKAEQYQKNHPKEKTFILKSESLFGFEYADDISISSAKMQIKKFNQKQKKVNKPKKFWK